MKILLVFLIFLSPAFHPGELAGEANSANLSPAVPKAPSIVQFKKKAMDHAVLGGERATDAAGSVTEHLAPLIFMVIAFLITIMAGSVLWERKQVWGKAEPDNIRTKRLPVMTTIAGFFVLCTTLLLWNFTGSISSSHRIAINEHHMVEIFLSVGALILLFISILVLKKLVFIIASAVCELIVIIWLLNICSDNIFRICNETCVMLGAQAGISYDQPCSDNIAFMTLHHTNGIPLADYRQNFNTTPLPLFSDYSSPIAMHNPLFPNANIYGNKIKSDPITFTLSDDKNLIKSCSLYINFKQFSFSQIESESYFLDQTNNYVASWERSGNSFNKKLASGSTSMGDPNISYQTCFIGDAQKISYVTYKYVVSYLAYLNEDSLPVEKPEEIIKVTFALQDFHEILPMYPAPVYVQGSMGDLLDVLFIPAKGYAGNDVLNDNFFKDFRQSCRSIINDAVFVEPSLKFWRKQFNFWINKQTGQVGDARCSTCCHLPPENFDGDIAYISEDIEIKALLHKDLQWDFTDHCNNFFSAEMNLFNDNNERSSFLHELGHAAYGLSDEYYGGLNEEASDHLPNNWQKRKSAESDASSRRKTADDVKKLF